MRINKQAVLDKIDAYYVTQAEKLHQKQVAQEARWNKWRSQQTSKSPALATALRDLAVRVEAGELVTEHDIDQAVDKRAHDRTVPYNQRDGRGDYEYPKRCPDVEDVEKILARYREGGRFADLLGVLHNMVGDDVAVSSLQKLGVLDTTDARLIFAANKSAS